MCYDKENYHQYNDLESPLDDMHGSAGDGAKKYENGACLGTVSFMSPDPDGVVTVKGTRRCDYRASPNMPAGLKSDQNL